MFREKALEEGCGPASFPESLQFPLLSTRGSPRVPHVWGPGAGWNEGQTQHDRISLKTSVVRKAEPRQDMNLVPLLVQPQLWFSSVDAMGAV